MNRLNARIGSIDLVARRYFCRPSSRSPLSHRCHSSHYVHNLSCLLRVPTSHDAFVTSQVKIAAAPPHPSSKPCTRPHNTNHSVNMHYRCLRLIGRTHCPHSRSASPYNHSAASRSLSTAAATTFTVNNRTYRLPPPASHTVAILIDGSAIDYLDAASAAGHMPNYNRLLNRTTFTPAAPPSHPASTHKYTPYFSTTPSPASQCSAQLYRASGCMPSYTNPNNVSVITGVPPRVHGIAGNYYYDRQAHREVMMNDAAMIRGDTILEAAEQCGARVTVVTVKDKLRRLLTKGLREADMGTYGAGRHVSIEKLDDAALPGMDLSAVIRDVYEPMCSISALQLGVSLIQHNIAASSASSPPHIYYFTTTDYVQHKAAPGHPLTNAFYAGIDGILGQLAGLPVPVRFAFTADHGMSSKARDNGEPRVVYLSDVLEQHYPNGSDHDQWRIILPITDPHPRHHGALGGYATVYLTHPTPQLLADMCGLLRRQKGVYTAMAAAEAAVALELPLDRIGDIVVLADRDWAVGKSHADHAASLKEMEKDRQQNTAREGAVVGAGEGGLRSHGGLDEMMVPLFISDASELDAGRRKRLMQGKGRNYDMFDVLLNGGSGSGGASSAARSSAQW